MSAGAGRRSATTALLLVGVSLSMFGLAFASVPLYRLFCQVTGFGGTTQVAEALPDTVSEREVTVRFTGNVAPGLPWDFAPEVTAVKARLGEPMLIAYKARNRTGAMTAGNAVFNVTPDKAGIYFNKIDCFCFSEQFLGPNQAVDMPVYFFVDPELATAKETEDVHTITLSYTFFPDPDADLTAKPQPMDAAANSSYRNRADGPVPATP